jgi:hypothetical protein
MLKMIAPKLRRPLIHVCPPLQVYEEVATWTAGATALSHSDLMRQARLSPEEEEALNASLARHGEDEAWGGGESGDCAMVDLCRLIEQHSADP